MGKQNSQKQTLIEKIYTLPPDKVAEVEDFVDFLQKKAEDRHLIQVATKISENVFRKVWDNPDDANYDRL